MSLTSFFSKKVGLTDRRGYSDQWQRSRRFCQQSATLEGLPVAELTRQRSAVQVWLYRPVALEEQARELLRARRYDAALALADVGAAAGDAWAPMAFAEAAFLLLHGRCPVGMILTRALGLLHSILYSASKRCFEHPRQVRLGAELCRGVHDHVESAWYRTVYVNATHTQSPGNASMTCMQPWCAIGGRAAVPGGHGRAPALQPSAGAAGSAVPAVPGRRRALGGRRACAAPLGPARAAAGAARPHRAPVQPQALSAGFGFVILGS